MLVIIQDNVDIYSFLVSSAVAIIDFLLISHTFTSY